MFTRVGVWIVCFVFFFFKQKTAYEMRISDWSSDVCSSDLDEQRRAGPLARDAPRGRARGGEADDRVGADRVDDAPRRLGQRVGGRRVGKGLGEMEAAVIVGIAFDRDRKSVV